MFTGIIEAQGTIKEIAQKRDIAQFTSSLPKEFKDVKIGDSISVNGTCLTIVEITKDKMIFDVMKKTLEISSLGNLKPNDTINLERSLKFGERVSGHLVTGHIDCKGIIKNISKRGNSAAVEIVIEKQFLEQLVLRCSIAVDGISLTVSKIKPDSFTVNIIPYTLSVTTLGVKKRGSSVNIELDMMGKYAKRSSYAEQRSSTITEEFLKDRGFA